MKSQVDWDDFFMEIAYTVSQQSYAADKKVGCLIVKGDQILSYSYNGTPRGWNNNTNNPDGTTKKETIHAEMYAIAKVARSTVSLESATMYVTTAPCSECAKMIVVCGFARIVYGSDYKNCDGLDILKKAGLTVIKSTDSINVTIEHCELADYNWLKDHTGLT